MAHFNFLPILFVLLYNIFISLSFFFEQEGVGIYSFLSFSPYTPPIFFHALARVHACTHTHSTHTYETPEHYSVLLAVLINPSVNLIGSLYLPAHNHILSLCLSLSFLYSLSQVHGSFLYGSRQNILSHRF